MDWVDRPQNYNDFYGILQLLKLSHTGSERLTCRSVRVAASAQTMTKLTEVGLQALHSV